MKLLLAMVLVTCPAWAQPNRSDGDPSPTVRQQQELDFLQSSKI
jgi:hypothetical protein